MKQKSEGNLILQIIVLLTRLLGALIGGAYFAYKLYIVAPLGDGFILQISAGVLGWIIGTFIGSAVGLVASVLLIIIVVLFVLVIK